MSSQVKKVIDNLINNIGNAELLSTNYLYEKVASYVKNNPEDYSAGHLSVILEKLAGNKPTIKKSEFKNLYVKTISANSRIRNIFNEELSDLQKPIEAKKAEKISTKELPSYKFENDLLASALYGAFDGKKISYSQDLANKANQETKTILALQGISPKTASVVGGNEYCIVVSAGYETPKGVTNIYIPVAILKDKLVKPEMFFGSTAGNLNKEEVTSYVRKNAGQTINFPLNDLLDFMKKEASGEISSVEFAAIKLASKKSENKMEFAAPQILGKEIQAMKREVVIPRSGEFESFESRYNSSQGAAAFLFGEQKVRLAATTLQQQLRDLGYKTNQIKIAKVSDKNIHFGVTIDGLASFQVPMKVVGNIKPADVFIANGSIKEFSKNEIQKLIASKNSDHRVAAFVSSQSELSSEQLLNNIRVAMEENNLSKAEDALNVLAQSKDQLSYHKGFDLYKNFLQKNASVTEDSKCSLKIKTATSKHLVCGHTNLPLHKVYQDKHGNCLPNHRKQASESPLNISDMLKIFGK